MFKRRVEEHQQEMFTDADTVRRYAEHAESSTLKYQTFLKTCANLNIGTRLLDVGAGPGVLAVQIAQQFPKTSITALDSSELMIEAGQRYVADKELRDRIQFVHGDAADTALISSLGEFDFIYSTYTLHHWRDPKLIIQNLRDVLADKGTLYLYDMRRAWWLYWVPSKSGFFKSVRAAYLRPEVEAMLAEMGITGATIRNEMPFLMSVIIEAA